MTKLASVLVSAGLTTVLGSGLAIAQSSGNFSSTAITPACAITSGTGVLTGPTCPVPTSSTPPGSPCGLMSSTIKTSSGNGVTLKVTPSLVTGLFSNTNLLSTNKNSSGITTATADVGIQVCVTTDSGTVLAPNCVIYDQRFQQLSTNLFNVVTSCALAGTTPAICCTDGTGGTSTCTDPVDIATCSVCNIQLILSTLSAHSFDFVVPVSGGTHTLTASWGVFGSTSTGATVGSCVGPGIITVEQVKVFNNSGATLSF